MAQSCLFVPKFPLGLKSLLCLASSVLLSIYLAREDNFNKFSIILSSIFNAETGSELNQLNNYALNYYKALNLSRLELNIGSKLATILTNLENHSEHHKCRQYIQKYLEEHMKDLTSLKQGSNSTLPLNNIPDNPLLTFRMIRRISVILLQYVMKNCNKIEAVTDFISNAFPDHLPPPNQNDLSDAILGILRPQYIYMFNATQLRLGIFADVHTNVKLSTEECLILADFAMDHMADAIAYQWLISANLTLKEDSDYALEEHLEASWKKLLTIWKKNSADELKPMFQNIHEPYWADREVVDFYQAVDYYTCRGESILTEKQKSQLFCRLDTKRHPYFFINPLKEEFHHINPPVSQFHGFVSDAKIRYLEEKASSGFNRSVVGYSGNERTVSFDRTSLSNYVENRTNKETKTDPKVVSLIRRIELVTGFHALKAEASDPMQIVTYSPGAHFDFHDDAWPMSPKEMPIQDNRIATFFLILSDVAMGGYTAFNNLGIFVKPEKGSALYWRDLYRHGAVDTRKRHCGCVVVLGSKLVANKWIRYNENFLRYPCTLNPKK